jgi:hypothetical protein
MTMIIRRPFDELPSYDAQKSSLLSSTQWKSSKSVQQEEQEQEQHHYLTGPQYHHTIPSTNYSYQRTLVNLEPIKDHSTLIRSISVAEESDDEYMYHDIPSIHSTTSSSSYPPKLRPLNHSKSLHNLNKYDQLQARNNRRKHEIEKLNEHIDLTRALGKLERTESVGFIMTKFHKPKPSTLPTLGSYPSLLLKDRPTPYVKVLHKAPFQISYRKHTQKDDVNEALRKFLETTVEPL